MLIFVFFIVVSILGTQRFSQEASATSDEPLTLEGLTDQGTFKVELHWLTSDIGSANRFDLVFRDNYTGTIVENVRYDWDVIGSTPITAYHRINQNSTSQEVTFPSGGAYNVRISNIEGLGEGITFHIEVTPELQPEALPSVFALAIVASILIGKRNGNLFRSRNGN